MLTVKACSVTGLLESVLTKFFTVNKFGNTVAVTTIFSSKTLKVSCRFKKWKKNWEKVFYFLYFLDNCIWNGSGKFSQSWTRYISSAVNVVTKTPKILPSTRGDIFQISVHDNDEKHEKSTLIEISQAFGTLSHVDCQSVFWNGTFYIVF